MPPRRLENYSERNMLRYGFTTGSCAAAAAKAAALMLLGKKKIEYVDIYTPNGTEFETEVLEASIGEDSASCAVRKYSGDDPDVTDGMLIFAEVSFKDGTETVIDGGEGIGRVTKAGLWQKIGEAAINKVPREMIEKEVREVFDLYGREDGAKVIISAPEGRRIAERTFNPRLGIEGGISILGTSGIVEPMSEKALLDAIGAEMGVKRANEGNILLMTPGNYGADFIKNTYGIDIDRGLKCSNFIGATLDMALEKGFKGVLLVGHIGKLVKTAGGIMDTHSRNADCRMEILAANSARYTDDINTVRGIMSCLTTDEAVGILSQKGILEPVMRDITEKALFYMKKRVGDKLDIGIIIFSNELGVLGKSDNADAMLEIIKGVQL